MLTIGKVSDFIGISLLPRLGDHKRPWDVITSSGINHPEYARLRHCRMFRYFCFYFRW